MLMDGILQLHSSQDMTAAVILCSEDNHSISDYSSILAVLCSYRYHHGVAETIGVGVDQWLTMTTSMHNGICKYRNKGHNHMVYFVFKLKVIKLYQQNGGKANDDIF